MLEEVFHNSKFHLNRESCHRGFQEWLSRSFIRMEKLQIVLTSEVVFLSSSALASKVCFAKFLHFANNIFNVRTKKQQVTREKSDDHVTARFGIIRKHKIDAKVG